ncbi:uridine diphosphate glucose pyrophosphatase NUDT14-like isoform X1 [Stegodyphus dumicola]|uniref:uridine diphosphate glucose pyrophosphatase NUDT14-like isoform X1 n=1 Tax=Stegodyphus dumicola TaxID=202533 RepID=UPI0015AD4E50|nr:uridine diphosphate glucose pyrophosphatase NUDT14-like isoform X1 [Stegodyphus dumicola]
MDNITNVKIVECDESMYLKPARMLYEQNGIKKSWDLMRIHDSVGIIIFNVTREVLLFVKQFRPAVYYAEVKDENCEEEIDTKKYPPNLGMTIELCAGIVDKVQSLAETARDEILEECGYSVPLTSLQRVTSYRSGVGVTGSNQTLFYVEVTDSMKVSQGGGNNYEGEYIEVIEMDLEQAYSLIYDEKVPRPASLMLALMWFFRNKTSRIVQKL